MLKNVCRWGILGSAVIAQKNWQSILNSGNGVLKAVASRDVKKAEAFISARQAEVPFETCPVAMTYDQVLASDEIDAVYIPLPTGIRKEWAIKAARAGKHVMCEKPCAVHASDLQEIIDVCREHNVQFMDGVMFMHSQRMNALRETLDRQAIGKVRRLQSHFSFMAPEQFLLNNIRMSSDLEPHGSLGDLGWYSIRMALFVMNYQMPVEVTAKMLHQQGRQDSPQAVPLELVAEIKFDNDVSFHFISSFMIDQQQTFTISGTKGSIFIDDFVLPKFGGEVSFLIKRNDFQVNGCQFNMVSTEEKVSVQEFSNSHKTSQETVLFRTFSDLVINGKPDPFWPEVSLKTQRVLDACLKSAQQSGQPVQIH